MKILTKINHNIFKLINVVKEMMPSYCCDWSFASTMWWSVNHVVCIVISWAVCRIWRTTIFNNSWKYSNWLIHLEDLIQAFYILYHKKTWSSLIFLTPCNRFHVRELWIVRREAVNLCPVTIIVIPARKLLIFETYFSNRISPPSTSFCPVSNDPSNSNLTIVTLAPCFAPNGLSHYHEITVRNPHFVRRGTISQLEQCFVAMINKLVE